MITNPMLKAKLPSDDDNRYGGSHIVIQYRPSPYGEVTWKSLQPKAADPSRDSL